MTELEKQVHENLEKLVNDSNLQIKLYRSVDGLGFSVQSNDGYVFSLDFNSKAKKLSNDCIWFSMALLSLVGADDDIYLGYTLLENIIPQESFNPAMTKKYSTSITYNLKEKSNIQTELVSGSEGLNKLNHALGICLYWLKHYA